MLPRSRRLRHERRGVISVRQLQPIGGRTGCCKARLLRRSRAKMGTDTRAGIGNSLLREMMSGRWVASPMHLAYWQERQCAPGTLELRLVAKAQMRANSRRCDEV